MTRDRGARELRDAVRDAFRTADGEDAPSVEGLLARVPGMIEEARSRRENPVGPIAVLIVSARRVIPRLAVAAALLVLAAVWVGSATEAPTGTAGSSTDLDRLLLTGSVDATTTDDVLLEAIAPEGNTDG